MKCCICARNWKHLHLLQIFKRFLVCRGTRDFGVHHTNFVTCAASVLCPHIILHIVKLLSSCSYERTPANLKIDRVKTLTPHTLNHFFLSFHCSTEEIRWMRLEFTSDTRVTLKKGGSNTYKQTSEQTFHAFYSLPLRFSSGKNY